MLRNRARAHPGDVPLRRHNPSDYARRILPDRIGFPRRATATTRVPAGILTQLFGRLEHNKCRMRATESDGSLGCTVLSGVLKVTNEVTSGEFWCVSTMQVIEIAGHHIG